MIYLDLTKEEFINKNPVFKELPTKCKCVDDNMKPYRTKRCLGLTCQQCGASSFIYLDIPLNREFLSLFGL
jgi:hypothetical protein